ncbi:hypothetical protein PSTG_15049 [Puccinia striiformis f. sp. tritici PST-78]|uniref:Uncharacterized protein n=1 Tax=Puccinia striiformis f. sp. tritici PST-78 TaxID=1165861 RepID=A0A0L0UWW2_9BASI|nr:hypothetical protein PSTG_15049 [Puccinia striiformis f. sp. tritici PST-78]
MTVSKCVTEAGLALALSWGEVAHKDFKNHTVNLAAMSIPQAHKQLSDTTVLPIQPHTQLAGLHKGLAQWHVAGTKTGPPGVLEVQDPSLMLTLETQVVV